MTPGCPSFGHHETACDVAAGGFMAVLAGGRWSSERGGLDEKGGLVGRRSLEAGGWWDSRAASAAREPWPPTRRSPRRLPQALTRPRHAAVSKTDPDGMRVRIAAVW